MRFEVVAALVCSVFANKYSAGDKFEAIIEKFRASNAKVDKIVDIVQESIEKYIDWS